VGVWVGVGVWEVTLGWVEAAAEAAGATPGWAGAVVVALWVAAVVGEGTPVCVEAAAGAVL